MKQTSARRAPIVWNSHLGRRATIETLIDNIRIGMDVNKSLRKLSKKFNQRRVVGGLFNNIFGTDSYFPEVEDFLLNHDEFSVNGLGIKYEEELSRYFVRLLTSEEQRKRELGRDKIIENGINNYSPKFLLAMLKKDMRPAHYVDEIFETWGSAKRITKYLVLSLADPRGSKNFSKKWLKRWGPKHSSYFLLVNLDKPALAQDIMEIICSFDKNPYTDRAIEEVENGNSNSPHNEFRQGKITTLKRYFASAA